MGFTTKEGMVRVDLFKESGKWYDTVELDMNKREVYFYKGPIVDRISELFQQQYPGRYQDMTAVCLEPYFENKFPIMWKVW